MLNAQKPLIFAVVSLLAMLFILISGPLLILNIPFLLIQIFGVLLIIWALLAKKVNNNHHHGLPRDLFLVTKGPYEIIRHPMYAGILFIMVGYVQGYVSFPRFVAFGILLLFIVLKILNDESRMEQEVKEYHAYQKRTHRLIPYFY